MRVGFAACFAQMRRRDTRRSDSGADFLVMRGALDARELVALCDAIPIPVFARGVELEEAWGYGATGLNDLGAGSP